MSVKDDQQFCLRWNNFQANITSQFETLRDDEDFTDVTIACEGQRLQAHKVVLSACSPFFKELFKSNPCPHPIIFMRDVEAQHIVALMEFMYAGEVNVAQAHLSAFLKTAESLRIRGLTDTSSSTQSYKERDEQLANKMKFLINECVKDTVFLNAKPSFSKHQLSSSYMMKQRFKSQISSTSTVTSSQDVPASSEKPCSPPPKRQCKNERIETELSRLKEFSPLNEESISVNPFATQSDEKNIGGDVSKSPVHPKIELPDYLSDDDRDDTVNFFHSPEASELPAGMEIIPQTPSTFLKEPGLETNSGTDGKKLHSLDPRPCEECGRVYSNLSNLRQHMKLIHYPTYVQCPICQKDFKTDLYLRRHMLGSHEMNRLSGTEKYNPMGNLRLSRRRNSESWSPNHSHLIDKLTRFPDSGTKYGSEVNECTDNEPKNRLVKLGEGIEIYEDQLRSVKWSDYRKLTRGLATILFSPAELATCSVTGQRWSRAGSGERPVKPALNRTKVQAIISYVANRFPTVQISRIKQVLAYKCKENSTALKMKAVRYYSDTTRETDK